MLNTLLNRLLNASIMRQMKDYHSYPAAKTAVVFVDAQQAFLDGQPEVTDKMAQLQSLARSHKFHLIYAPYGGVLRQNYPSPAQRWMRDVLKSQSKGGNPAKALVPQKDEIILKKRTALSAFYHSKLAAYLQKTGIEHLVMAGAYANLGLDSTLRDAVQWGYHTTILSDCCGASSPEDAWAVTITAPRYAHLVCRLDEFAAMLDQS